MDTSVQFALGDKEPYKDAYLQLFPEARFDTDDYFKNFKVQVSCPNTQNHRSNDKHKSAFISTLTGVFFCSTCGVSYSFRNFLIEVMGFDVTEAIRAANDITKDSTKIPKFDEYQKGFIQGTNELTKFVEACQAKLTPALDIVSDYCKARNIKYDTLVKLGVGYVPAGSNQLECLVFPYYLNGKVVCVRGRTFDGRKGGIKGSRFVPYNIDTAKANVVLCEGESDTIKCQELLDKYNLPYSAVGVPSAQFREEFIRDFTGIKKVFILPQNDSASTNFAKTAYAVLKESLTRNVDILRLPFKRGDSGKDLCDFLFEHDEAEFISLFPKEADTRQLFFTHKDFLEHKKLPIDWIVENLIQRGQKIIIGGEQKSLKTYFTMFMMHDLIKGLPLFGIKELTPPKPVKVLFIEEEGSKDDLAARAVDAISTEDTDNILYGHKIGLKLDSKLNLDIVEEYINSFKPDLLVLDPLQRLHLSDEDSATEMAVVWDNIHALTMHYPFMTIIIIQHFRKGGGTQNYWDSLRGSNRGAGEVDLGIFIRKEQKKDLEGNTILSIRYDGRSVKAFESIANEYSEFKIAVNTNLWNASIYKGEAIDLTKPIDGEFKAETTSEAVVYKLLDKGHLTVDELSAKASLTKQQVRSIIKENEETFSYVKLPVDGKNKFFVILTKNKDNYGVKVSLAGLE